MACSEPGNQDAVLRGDAAAQALIGDYTIIGVGRMAGCSYDSLIAAIHCKPNLKCNSHSDKRINVFTTPAASIMATSNVHCRGDQGNVPNHETGWRNVVRNFTPA